MQVITIKFFGGLRLQAYRYHAFQLQESYQRRFPIVTYRFYSSLWDRERGRRFRDLPAFRGFVGYQVRLITTLIANCNGYQLEDPVVIAQANFPLRESDLFEMQGLLEELEAQGLVSSDTAAVVATEIEILRERLFDDVNV